MMTRFTLSIIFCIIALTSFGQDLITSVEAESGVLVGVSIATQTGGSSNGYVTGFDADGDKVTVTVNVPTTNLYKLVIRFRAQDPKTQNLLVNDILVANISFPKTTDFTDLNAGKILLNAGNNTLSIVKNWGYMDVDKFSIYTAPPNVYDITTNLIDAYATPATKDLYTFMLSQFNKRIISGQTTDHYDDVKAATGHSPLLRDYDMLTYSPMYPYAWQDGVGHVFGPVDNHDAENAIAWYNSTNKKGIVSFQWHWYSPSGGTAGTNTFSTDNTTFDVTKAVIDGTQEHTDILRDIDAIAVQLKKLSDANVPILWRPLHEAGGGWFWWGAKGSNACKALWDIVYDRITNYHNLHNMIWIWSTPEEDWYLGNNKIDILGFDSYPGAFEYTNQKIIFDQLYTIVDGKKLIAMSENGPIPDIDLCFSQDAPWSYFMTWNDMVTTQNSDTHLKAVYSSTYVVTLENIDDAPVTPPVVTAVDDTEKAILVYPNPVKNMLLFSEALKDEHITSTILYDLKGNKLYEYDGYTESISFEKFSPGMYVLNVITPRKTRHYKIIK